jgi:two-component system, LytTR family, response regulator
MNILCVDDERLALDALTDSVQEVLPQATVFAYRSGKEALAQAEQVSFDVAFLDIEMREMNGLQLAKRLKELCRTTNIVFITGYEDYALDAFGVNASGYLMKPISMRGVNDAMENLRNPIIPKSTTVLRVQCFGNFEVFLNDVPIRFKYSKTKELFAYLIDRKGSICTNGELMAVLWEDEAGEKKRSYLSNLISDLSDTFSAQGVENVVMKRRGVLYVVPEKVSCDYYDWNKGMGYAVNAYCGEYMSQFSWAEMTLSAIERKK